MSSSLRERSLTAFLWGAGGTGIRIGLQIIAQIVMARILGPEQYGLFAICVLVIGLSAYFSDFGLAYGLIQRENIDATDVRFVLGWQIVLGLAVAACLFVVAPLLAKFFSEPRLTNLIRALAPICLLQAFSAVSLNLLKRKLDHRSIQIGQTSSYAIGYFCVGLPLATIGAQVWALVAAWGVQSVVMLLVTYRMARHPIVPIWRHPQARAMMRFGVEVLGTNLVNWVVANVDRLIIAKTLPAFQVGLYTTTYNLNYTPVSAAAGVVQPIMYAACARMDQSTSRIRDAYLTVVCGACMVLFPVFTVLAVVAGDFVHVVYGNGWNGAVPLFVPLALAMPLHMLWNINTPPLWASGKVSSEIKLQLPTAVIWFVAAGLAAQHSAIAVAWTVLLLFVMRWLVFSTFVCSLLDISVVQYTKAMVPGVIVSTSASGAAAVALYVMGDLPAAWRLGAAVFAAGLATAAAAAVSWPLMSAGSRSAISSLLHRLGRRVQSGGVTGQ